MGLTMAVFFNLPFFFFFLHSQYHDSDIFLDKKKFAFYGFVVVDQINGVLTEFPIKWNILGCFQFFPIV